MIFHLLDFRSWKQSIASITDSDIFPPKCLNIPQPEQEKSFSFLEILTGEKNPQMFY